MTLLSVMYIQCITLHTDDSKDMSVLIKPTNLNMFSLIKQKKKLVLGHVILSNFRLASVVFRNVWFVSDYFSFSSVHSIVSNSLRPCGLQHAKLPCPSPPPGACSNSRPSSQWCHPTISSSVIPFSSCLQSFPASGTFPMNK